MGGKRNATAALTPAKSLGTQCTGSCLGLGTGLDGRGKSRPTGELCSVFTKKALEHFTLLISNSESSSICWRQL